MSRTDLGLRWVALMLLLALPCSLHADNIVLNPGFESGSLSPWFVGGNACSGPCAPWAVTSSDAHSGSFSAMDTGNIELRQNFVSIATVAITDVSFWIKHPALALPAIGNFYFTDGTWQLYILATTDSNWDFVDVHEAPSQSSACFLEPSGRRTPCLLQGKRLDGFSVFGYDGGPPGTLPVTLVDDVTISFTKTPESGSLVLLGTALGALIARRKSRFHMFRGPE